mmetsp:Transcript_18243/g.29673  ORF Transcript_18243/g.29673 Transcript_18243/m.29673 type:complete len:514 (-) Transcript_18243:91-1632(-)|eukprot:CAMPEP_0202032932 /NCGR_PEP_ID=MMETSP0905-20130828/65784_1 /ASSEMBLY_ACC=CAM_ASM_000554 /TAXON_ID=420261 /ORGANISM="Thalassiosira antarctica, Strain CCMP982" /LENGTH=513 /DNA_ID=CAMNT_0048596809 /DNA_START=42 /DNA_END=1580 /DNA_ORIENTATION=-
MGAKTQPQTLQMGVDSQLTDRALRALLKHHESSSSEKELLGNDLDVQVQFSLARIPGSPSPKPIRIEIPHPLFKVASSSDNGDAMDEDDDNLQDVEACLIVKEESKPWVQEMIAKFPEQLGCIKKVLGLQSLRKKHKSFTQRRELLDRFDVFFADDRILPMLTKALGGKFFDKKKQPIPVKLTRKEALPFAIQKCLTSTFMYLSAGTCVTIKAGNTAMSQKKLLSNIQSICSIVPTKVPRKYANIRSISIKTTASVALPVYNKTPEELEEIMELAKEKKPIVDKEEETEDDKGSKKRKVAAATSPLAKALKKQKAVEAKESDKLEDEVAEKPKKSAKKAKTPKSTKKKSTESISSSDVVEEAAVETPKVEEAAAKTAAKTPKSSKKKKTKEVVESKVEEEAKEAKTPKSSKKRKSKAEDSTTAASAKKTPKKNSVESTKDANFIASKKFSGAKKGFVFKKSNLGIGYYKDVIPTVDKSWFASPKSRGGGGGGRKPMTQTKARGKKGGKPRRSF